MARATWSAAARGSDGVVNDDAPPEGGLRTGERDLACAAIARGQFGCIGRFQALAHLSSKSIHHRVRSRRWRQVAPETYIVDGSPRSYRQDVMVAVLWIMARRATRLHSCASYTTAAFLHGLLRFELPIHVTTPRDLVAYSSSVSVHRTEVEAVDIEKLGPIPTTTVARTLLDLGAVLDLDGVESCLERALLVRKVSIPRLQWQLDRCGGRGARGSATLRRLLEDRARGYIPSESELELRLWRALRQAQVPTPVKQRVHRDESGRSIARVDFSYPRNRLVIEVHGWKYHSARARWQRDLQRNNDLLLTGERVLVFSWTDVVDRTSQVIRTIKKGLELTDPQASLPIGETTGPHF